MARLSRRRQDKSREREKIRMEVMGGDQRSSDCTGRRKLLGGEIYGNKRRRTTTAMQNFLTFKRIKTAASEVESARRGSSFHGLTRGRWQPLVSDSKFGQRQQPSSQGELLTNDRRRTATTMPTPTLTTTVTLRTKTTSLEVEIARRGSSFHGSIR